MQPVLDALCAIRAPLAYNERELYALVARALEDAGIPFEREARIGPRCRVDFLCESGVALEVKRGKPCASQLLLQLRRYAACERVEALVVVVERAAYAPQTVGGKPCRVFGLNRLWGVTV